MLQGRGDVSYQFVKTYYLLYSMDGIMWVNVTSPNQQPQLFIGNNDTNTVVKSSLVPSITTVYLRINPRSYNHHISLRFDVSGCYIVKETKGRSEFYRVPLLPSQDYTQHVLFETLSSSLPECDQQCHKDKECGFFSFDMNQGNCRGFVSTPTTYSAFSTGLTPSFVKRGLFTSLGYRQIKNESLIYRVNGVSLNQTSASNVCIQQHSQLLKIAFESEMLSLQTIVAGNTIL
ncbi:uncharacterized protein LOC132564847, partial [Ylistrum balloti]|uniref:uncharacterized protein LOC132564847 n=1 Tax=Ylistrum balloti TaxID=509963 RepID=UPI002905A27C